MTDYDGNGDYTTYNDDDNDYTKQRKGPGGGGGGGGPHNGDMSNHDHDGGGSGIDLGQINEKANEYLRDCLTEKNRMERKFPIAEKLLDCEIEKVQATGRIPSREQKYADIYREKPLRVSQKVLVPIREHPKFNFVGKLLGPKGNSLRRLQEETLCKMTVLGRNSMRDRVKEEELRNSKDPKYAHLNSDLHVEISTIAPPAEAYARIAYAMAELRKYLIPDSNDVIRQEQLRELMDNSGISDNNDGSKTGFKKMSMHQQQQLQGGGGVASNMVGNMGMNAASSAAGVGNSSTAVLGGNKSMTSAATTHHSGGYSRPTQQHASAYGAKNPIPPKQKVLSILEKARTAMDETYGRGYEEHIAYEPPPPASYDAYGHAHTELNSVAMGGVGVGMGNTRYDQQQQQQQQQQPYDLDYNRRDYYLQSPSYGVGSANTVNSQSTGLNPNHNRSHVNR